MIKKKYIAISCLILFSMSLLGNSRASLVDRKKNFDSKAKFLLKMQDIITSEKLSTEAQSLKDTVAEIDTTYRSGEKDKIRKTLSLGEVKVSAFQKEYSTFISTETKELMDAYSSQATSAAEKEADKNSKPTVSYTSAKEKSTSYFNIAKTDYANATKFERDGNLQYAIQLFKRSLKYTVLAYENANFQLPEKFATLSKKSTESEESEVAPIGTHSNPAKETNTANDTRKSNPIKSIK